MCILQKSLADHLPEACEGAGRPRLLATNLYENACFRESQAADGELGENTQSDTRWGRDHELALRHPRAPPEGIVRIEHD